MAPLLARETYSRPSDAILGQTASFSSIESQAALRRLRALTTDSCVRTNWLTTLE